MSTAGVVEAVLKILLYSLGWLAARGFDAIIGRWVAYFTIAWESTATEAGKKAFREGLARVREDAPEKYANWQEWRKKTRSASNVDGSKGI